MIGLVFAPSAARARAMGVDVWSDRGKDAIYEPGEPVEIKVRASDDAYLMVYDIDSEGYVRVLYPYEENSGFIEGRHTYRVPPYQSGLQLVVQGPVGQGYIVALASHEPFNALPWYLRPYDPKAENTGYVGEEDDQEDVTSDGRIMGDPFVAMERIRRKVLENPNDDGSFATAYTSYYVHEAVRYPRYLCNDCHRPAYWSWWDGWDPYYTNCSAFDFRIYWGWSWGPRYWFGSVPYFCYVPRCYPCAPYDRPWYSSWNGWRQWNGLWSGHLTRYKSPPPAGYTPPGRYDGSRWKEGKPLPPGFLPRDYAKGDISGRVHTPGGANRPSIVYPGMRPNPGGGLRPGGLNRPGVKPTPVGRPGSEGGTGTARPRDAWQNPGRGSSPGSGSGRPRGDWQNPGRGSPSGSGSERPRGDSRPAPARGDSHAAPPKNDTPRGESHHSTPASRPTPARDGSSGGGDQRHGWR
jgi:hypothetical protein